VDQVREACQTAKSGVDAAEAQLKFAEDQVSFTELKADAAGVVTAVGAEPGEVVQAGRMIVAVAHQGGRDAVFDVPAQVIRSAPNDVTVTGSLSDDPSVTTTAGVRAVATQDVSLTWTYSER